MVQLGLRGNGALAAAAADTLLDRHRGRNAVNGIDAGPRGRLHHGARIGVERLEIAPLALVEQDVEGQRGLAAARDARDDREGIAGDG